MNRWTRPTWCPHSQHAYPSFHICIDPATPGHTLVFIKNPKKSYQPGPLSEEHKQKLSEAQKERWAARRAKNAKRDREILEACEGGLTYREAGRHWGIHPNQISLICKRQRAVRFEEQHGTTANAS